MTTINSSNSSPTVIIKKLEYPPEIIEELDNSFQRLRTDQEAAIIRSIGTKQCCVCQKLLEYEVNYRLENATNIERYCIECFNKGEGSDSIKPSDYFVMARKQ